MTRLVSVEIRRLWMRYFTKVAALLAAAVIALSAWSAVSALRPVAGEELAAATSGHQQALRDWEVNGADQVLECETAQAEAREGGDATADFQCDQLGPPELSMFIRPVPTLREALGDFVGSLASALPFFGFLIGASGVAAEFTTGSLGLWLTFVPRRTRVLVSKLVATPVVVGAMMTVALAVGVAAIVMGGRAVGAQGVIAASDTTTVALQGLRLVAATMLASVCGAAMGALTRHTAGAIGIALGWGVVVEGILAQIWAYSEVGNLAELQRWLILPNLHAWVLGGAPYQALECTTGAQGFTCQTVERLVSQASGGFYLLGLTLVLALVATLVFRRRDVS